MPCCSTVIGCLFIKILLFLVHLSTDDWEEVVEPLARVTFWLDVISSSSTTVQFSLLEFEHAPPMRFLQEQSSPHH